MMYIIDIGDDHYYGPKLVESTGSIYRSIVYVVGDAGKIHSIN